MKQLKYAIVGVGGLGGYYGIKLAAAGKDVHFLLNSDYEWVNQNGLRLDSIDGNLHLPTVQSYKQAGEMPACDVIMVCLKTTSNHLLAQILPTLTAKGGSVVLVQNGMGMEESLLETFPDLSLAGALAFICSSKVGPGHILHSDYGKLSLGWKQLPKPGLLEQVCDDLSTAGVSNEVVPDLMAARWRKLVWNIPYNGMSVILRTTTAELMAHDFSRQMLRQLMLEVIHAANACLAANGSGSSSSESRIDPSFADAMLASTARMNPYAPSMKLDYDHGRPMEIEAIYGNPIRLAQQAGYEMRQVALMENQLRLIQSQYIKT